MGDPPGGIPRGVLPVNPLSLQWRINVRAEFEKLTTDIKQSLSLLRRHL